MKSIASLLRELPQFKLLPDALQEALSQIAQLKVIKEGNILFFEGDYTEAIFYLVSGEIKSYKVDRFENEIYLYSLFDQMFISELIDIDHTTISCFTNLETVLPSKILIFDSQKFITLAKQHLEINHLLLQEFVKKTKLFQCLINRELVFDGSAKVSYMLLNEIERFNRLKRQQIAYELNIQPETLSRILKKFERKGYIAYDDDHHLVIANEEELIGMINDA